MIQEFSESVHCKDSCYSAEGAGTCAGISFCLPSRTRFIPYSWLLYAEMNTDGTELQFHYTHSLVIVSGTRLRELQQAVEALKLSSLREYPAHDTAKRAVVNRIEIREEAS